MFIGIQIPPHQRQDFENRMKNAKYDFTHEHDNPAFKLFLS
ncbi:MAG: hypothetical protein JW709_01610 [Sedimentisphaerales bacterium]|nr:hypothetical protein [Sedimentisphaerales bacterium]